MKFGFRMPSLKRRIAARTSLKRIVRHRLGLKAPKGMGIITNPKKYVYNKIYKKTTFGVEDIVKVSRSKKSKSTSSSSKRITQRTQLSENSTIHCPNCDVELRINGLGNYKCPDCKTQFKVTELSSTQVEEDITQEMNLNEVNCPNCETLLKINGAGTYRCPNCKHNFVV